MMTLHLAIWPARVLRYLNCSKVQIYAYSVKQTATSNEPFKTLGMENIPSSVINLGLGNYNTLIILIIIILLLLGAYIYSIQLPSNFPPSGQIVLPLVGTTYGHGKNPRYKYLHQQMQTRGPIIGGRFGPFLTAVLMDAEMIDEYFLKQGTKASGRLTVLNDEIGNALMGIFEKVDKVEGGYGIAGADGERWKRSRRLAWTSLFTTDRLKKFSTLLETESSLMEEYLSKCASTGVPIDPTSMFPNYTLRIISSMAFGKPLGYYDESTRNASNTTLSDPTKQINTIFSYLSAKFMHERLVPLFRRLPWAQYPHFRADVTNLWSMLDGLVSEAEHKHQTGPGSASTFIDLLIETRSTDDEFSSVDKQDITSMLMDFMLAGSDTTANTLGFALAEMINHPDVAERVYEEVQSVCGSTTPSVDHLNSLVFTEAVINEILRFHTIAPNGLPHRVVEPIEISGYHIPAILLANIWSLHHNEKYWSEPESFKPQRWIDNPELKKGKFFVPFSTGLRICPGRHLAMMEAKLALARLIHRFKFSAANGSEKIDIIEKPGLAVQPAPYKVVIQKRK